MLDGLNTGFDAGGQGSVPGTPVFQALSPELTLSTTGLGPKST